MDAEKIKHFVLSGKHCVWCNRQYDPFVIGGGFDFCRFCEDFRNKYYYDKGSFFTHSIDGVDFRCFMPYDHMLTDPKIKEFLKSKL